MSNKPPTKFIAHAPDGTITTEEGVVAFAQRYGLDKSEISKCLKGKARQHKGWKFFYPESTTKIVAGRLAESAEADVDSYKELVESGDFDAAELIKLAMTAQLKMAIGLVENGVEPPTGWNPANVNKSIELLAKTEGLDLNHLKDNRTPDQKLVDSTMQLMGSGSSIWEQTDEELDIMEEQFAKVATDGKAYVQHLASVRAKQLMPKAMLPSDQDPEEPPGPKTIAAAARLWIERIRRVRKLAQYAKEPYIEGMSRDERVVSQATHTLRYQLYVNRSDITVDHGRGRKSKVFTLGDPHIRMSMGLWFSRNQYGVTEHGVIAPGEPYKVPYENRMVPFPGAPYTGTMLMVPPRHGKTDFLKNVMGLEVGVNPHAQIAYIHDSEDEAQKVLTSVKHMFNRSKAQGRRNYRLFPYDLAKEQNGVDMLRIETDQATRAPNIVAYGLWSSKQGLNVDLLIGDDLVPQKDDNEATKRARRLTTWGGTWVSRLQGTDPHIILSGYPRHREDLMWIKYNEGIKAAKSDFRDGDPMWVLRMPVGGPQTTPKFKAIWPELYGPKQLRQRYRSLSSRSTWAANYMLQPITDDMKIVRKVRLVDIDDPRVQAMMRNAENRLSVDPAAKGDGTGDKAGMVVVTIGDLVSEEVRDGVKYSDRETLGIVRVAREFDATQLELMDEMRRVAGNMNVSMAYVEVVGGYGSAIIEALRTYHNVNSTVGLKPDGNKRARFKAVAGMLEHADPMLPAKIAFPARYPRDESGRIPEGAQLVPIEGMDKLISYIENFAVEEGFHSLDALTQACKEIMSMLGVGEGAFSREVGEGQRSGLSSNKVRMYEKIRKQQHAPSRRALQHTTQAV